MKSSLTLLALSLFAFVGIFFLASTSLRSPRERKEEMETPGQSDALKAFDWWYDQRAYPNELIPRGAYQRASNYVKTGKFIKSRDRAADGTGAGDWKSLGPNNVGGRTLAIAVNPSNSNIVWAGSASGGLWKSTTAGEGSPGWQFINTGFPLISVSAIAIDSTNPNIMFVGTGEISKYKRPLVGTSGARASYGMGILKSTDAGASWDTTGLAFTFPEITAIERIVINPQNSNTVYAATSEGTFKSTNGGKTWFLIHSVLMAMDIVINPLDTTMLYASYGNLNSTTDPGIYVTFDAGDNWSQLSNGLPSTNFGRTPLAISRSNPSIIYAGVSDASSGSTVGIFRTSNAGTTWTQTNSFSYAAAQAWYDNVVTVDPTNSNHIYFSGFDFYESTDGGATFTSGVGGQVHVDHHAITIDPNDPLTIYVGCDGGIFKSIDGGNQFSNLNQGYVTTQFYPGFSVSPTDSNVSMGGLQDNSTVQYVGGPDWFTRIGADGGWTAINSQNKNILYGEQQYLAIFRSTNGGGSFSNVNTGLPSGAANTNFIPPYTISYSSPNVLYAGNKTIYKTTTGGASWFPSNGNASPINGTNVSAVSASWTSPDTVMAATGQGLVGPAPSFKVYASTNGGAVWTDVTGTLPYRYPTDIEFDPVDSRVAYVTLSGYGSGHIFKTTDIGQSWTDISSNLPDIPHQAITADPEIPSHLYVGTDLGVFYSSNGGGTWEDYSSGMPPAMVLDVVVSRSNSALRAATFGNGVYERKLVRSPQVSLTSPVGGEVWIGGSIENITWSEKFTSAVKIQYSLNDGASWTTVTDSVPATFPHYPWIVPSFETTQGRIRITYTGNPSYQDTSNGDFTILVNPEVLPGWNMVSLDKIVPDGRKIILFPTSTTAAFAYAGNYVVKDTLNPGTGYWLKYGIPQHTFTSGQLIFADTLSLRAGWNMIGGLSLPVAVASITQIPPGIVVSSWFGYNTSYQTATSLQPKKAYWVKTNAAGNIVLASSGQVPSQNSPLNSVFEGANEITVLDAAGNSQTLAFSGDRGDRRTAHAELPPVPPEGAFDVRFASGKNFECAEGGDAEFAIIVRGAVYPIEIGWNVLTAGKFDLLLGDNGRTALDGRGSTKISAAESGRLALRISGGAVQELPTTVQLFQNYPNPFNPSTKIAYNIAASSPEYGASRHVSLKIYDVAGRVVATLVEADQPAGEYLVTWDARDVASGIYFSKLSVEPSGSEGSSGRIVQVKKAVLIR